jgi:beta-fructofuranosidase
MMSLPRVMNVDADGTLRLQVLPEAARLRAGATPPEEAREGVLTTLRKASGEVICAGLGDKSFEFSMSTDEAELLRVSYSPEKHSFTTDGHEVLLKPHDRPTLHAFVDGSVIELILGERTGYTKRFYYAGATAPDVRVHGTGKDGVTMNAWKINPISSNRLTTSRTA